MAEAASSSIPSKTSRFAFHRLCSTLANGSSRKVCQYGTKCHRSNPKHLDEEAHPADEDYLALCKMESKTPEFVSVYQLFRWCDMDGSGKAHREEMAVIWPQVQAFSADIGPLNDALWKELDDDGNGYVNFSEFAAYTTRLKIQLPLGLDKALGLRSGHGQLRCGVKDCRCAEFHMRRQRCRYGTECYQKKEEHRQKYCHPGDDDWEAKASIHDKLMCVCGHKQKLHASSMTHAGAVAYPRYWSDRGKSDEEFNDLPDVDAVTFQKLQNLVDATYDDKVTRDRMRHSGSWMVPRNFEVFTAARNENSKLWMKYCVKKAELQGEREHLVKSHADEAAHLVKNHSDEAAHLRPWEVFPDVKSTTLWEASEGEALDPQINEWYLWHGTSASAARNICKNDFKMRLAGSATGTLYGRGSYLAESITKADEYAKEEDGVFTVILCRVLGGRVKLCEEREPDAEALMADCVQGPYDCVLGDRRKVSGTYREFVIFDTENVYPEYILGYRRGEMFKSKSHP